MCTECRQHPHHYLCPDYNPPAGTRVCAACGTGIYEGEEYVEIDRYYYHYECLSEMHHRELLALTGVEIISAE